jgi:hypothetical protein
MPDKVPVYVELGSKRVFAGALEWPGWSRSGRDEQGALDALVEYAPRYKGALGSAARGFGPPRDVSALEVVERVAGNATTDFGAPSIAPAMDQGRLDKAGADRLARILRAAWAAFDAAAAAAAGAELRKGPRGGGRDLDAIVSHVVDSDRAYLVRLGGTYRKGRGTPLTDEAVDLREQILETFHVRAGGKPLPPTCASGARWTPQYFVRRSAWHALDHAWEIEDRATRPRSSRRPPSRG